MAVSFYKEGQSEGVLFPNNKTSPKSPDLTGTIKLTREDINALLEQVNEEGGGVLRIAAWKNQSSEGKGFLSINPQAVRRREETQKVRQQSIDSLVMGEEKGGSDLDVDLDDEIPF